MQELGQARYSLLINQHINSKSRGVGNSRGLLVLCCVVSFWTIVLIVNRKGTNKMAKKLTAPILKNRAISLAKSGQKYNDMMQELLIDIIEFVNNPIYSKAKDKDGNPIGNGNTTPATDLLDTITRKADHSAIKNWFNRHGGMTYSEEDKTFKRKRKVEYDLDKAKADLWYVSKENEKEDGPRTTKFDGVARFKSLLASMHKAIHEPKADDVKDNIPEGLFEELAEVFAKYSVEPLIKEETKEEPKAANTSRPAPAPRKGKAA